MADNFVPTDPTGSETPLSDARLDALQKRIAELEGKIELESLSAEGQHRQLLRREIEQRIQIRFWTSILAVLMLCLMAFVLWYATHRYLGYPKSQKTPAIVIALYVAPIASMTTITVMLLIGAFRRFKDDEFGPVNLASIAGEAAKAASGN
jgi:magnesium-transporting ATPase (P-type)